MSLTAVLKETLNLWLEISSYLLLGFLIAGILHSWLGEDFISQHLGGSSIKTIFKATLLGVPLPLCSCGVIPVASSLRKEGANKSSVLSFLISTPTTGVDSIFATYSLLGPLFAIFRPIAAFLSGWFVGILNFFLSEKERAKKLKEKHSHKISNRIKIKEALKYGFIEMPEDIGKWLIIGTFLGGLISALIPANLIPKHMSNPVYQYFFILLISVPLYVCATGSIPIAAALIQKGLLPGAALVFLIAGPATNTITMTFAYKKLGKKSFFIYLISLIIISILLGILFNKIWFLLGKNPSLISAHGKLLPYYIKILSGIIMFLLIINALFINKPYHHEDKKLKYEISVPDITCKHCKMTIENNLKTLSIVKDAHVDIENKKVYIDIENRENLSEIKEKIKESGYTPED